MKNFVQEGNTISLIAPYAVAAGFAALVGKIFGIAVNDVANGAEGEFATDGVYEVNILASDTVSQGAILYWDNTNKRLTTTAAGNTRVGVAILPKAAGVSSVTIKIDAVIV
jgi:predicted RecA/RadA family phage recombinase